MRNDFYQLPADLPVPTDDGASKHLQGLKLPSISLMSTARRLINLQKLTKYLTVIFLYPRTGRPDEPSPENWDLIPGARGCTPQSCGYRDHHSEFRALGFQVFGLSTQTTEFQQELVERIRLPFEILSDHEFKLTDAIGLPTFPFAGTRLLKRMAWVCERGVIAKVFYPVFPPDRNAENVIKWIKERSIPPTEFNTP